MQITLLLALLATSSGFVVPHAPRTAPTPRAPAPTALVPELPLQLLAEIVDASGERVYGAVDAPVWIAPLAGVAAIGTALLPVLLAPGEQAFNRQQGDEKKVKNEFGKRN
ncbi:hypothetical protein AB1Y20_005712 [Prymnesium parvum]|uniref:Photosystem I reaction center subunit VIII n=1 Tax=Prymnesium parvum TaxID=97485 RepID=A0AB34J2L7_PRYPA|mmetsp:Transcript_11178/g.27656  ORF Transcript_11178/g.27656 Transcript_11178/m.27656 type:complete len:110 (-) Transcript_11178:289-618(-)